MQRKLCVLLASAVLIHFLFIYAAKKPSNSGVKDTSPLNLSETNEENRISVKDTSMAIAGDLVNNKAGLYDHLQLSGLGLSFRAFEYALKGYNYLHSAGKITNDNLISIVDFSLPSSKKRLFIIDLKNNKLIYHTYVSHGRNSGKEMASEFSNQPESNKSSLGFYVTGETYIGKHGYSLRLLGEEKGINDNANNRAIVMHSATYVSESSIKMQGFIGRSLGCPALPVNLHKPIIEKIKRGSCLFLYSPDKFYNTNSALLKKIA